ncbi:MAG: hypothetical protein Q8P46_17830 [Hyphomicrobiales bacterium]|nr:hypothetical protein [Hyphomicrobiales bacterium]
MNPFDDMEIARESFAYRDLLGADQWDEFTVSTNASSVGALTAEGRYRIEGRKCDFQALLSAATTVATVARVTFINLPTSAGGLAGFGVMMNDTVNEAVGLCSISVSSSRCYLPTQNATSDVLKVYGSFEIGG